jgi:hypothetical protein
VGKLGGSRRREFEAFSTRAWPRVPGASASDVLRVPAIPPFAPGVHPNQTGPSYSLPLLDFEEPRRAGGLRLPGLPAAPSRSIRLVKAAMP